VNRAMVFAETHKKKDGSFVCEEARVIVVSMKMFLCVGYFLLLNLSDYFSPLVIFVLNLSDQFACWICLTSFSVLNQWGYVFCINFCWDLWTMWWTFLLLELYKCRWFENKIEVLRNSNTLFSYNNGECNFF